MKTAAELAQQTPLGETHRVHNVATDLSHYNLYSADTALVEAVEREGGAWGHADLTAFGQHIGQPEYLELGQLANQYKPELDTHDRFGNRVDLVRYHPAYHELMSTALGNGLAADPWLNPRAGAHVVRGAKAFMQSQVEAGHGCPVTMTFASVPSLRIQPEVAQLFESKVLAKGYDPRNVPIDHKTAITVGMGMTEKQGGSDVRANSTVAQPVGSAGPGQLYSLTGHKWFLSAPMCDVFLILAQTPAGVSCFAVPRWLPDGSKNPLQVIRLKNKMGNCSNASSEVEMRGALGWLIGEEGRGVPTIIEMVSLTRFDCMGASAGLMRVGLANAMHHCKHRAAFGSKLVEQPLMQNVLADLALEYEGAIALTMRMARALDHKDSDPHEANLARLMTAVGKYWICKRAPQHTYEVMECIGGSGVMENSIYPRLFRESVINPIWEGSGNVQCLDVLRALGKNPATLASLHTELQKAVGAHAVYDKYVGQLTQQFGQLLTMDAHSLQFVARHVVDQMALAMQASLLIQHAPNAVSDAYCNSRLGAQGHHHYGTLAQGTRVDQLLQRADPQAA